MTPTVLPQYNKLPELLALCIWREARGELQSTRTAVGCSIRNRTLAPVWWNGHKANDYAAVILMPWQYSSFNTNDPNSSKYPDDAGITDWQAWLSCQDAADAILADCPDLTNGADSYIDRSILGTAHQPSWATKDKLTLEFGRLYFYKIR